MADEILTSISALIGSISGSSVVIFLSEWIRRKGEKLTLRKFLVNEYLLQLQDSAESLWFRLDNIKNKGGRFVMEDEYFEESTLYALACVLAYNRIFFLKGVYSQIEDIQQGLGTFLRESLHQLDSDLDRMQLALGFYRYHRLALAESVIEKVNEDMRVSTFLSFKEHYKTDSIKQFLQPAKDFISIIKGPELNNVMGLLESIAVRLGQETGLSSDLLKKKAI